MNELRYRTLWTACGACFVLAVAYLSLMHDPPQTQRVMGLKAGHFVAYAWLMFWFAQLFESRWTRLLIAACICSFGIALEFMQAVTGYRTFSYFDMRDNSLGVAAGLMLMRTPLRGTIAAIESGFLRLVEE